MKLVFDLASSLQSGSGERGIGRYVRGLAKGLDATSNDHQLILALSANDQNQFSSLVDELREIAPRANVVGYRTLDLVKHRHCGARWNRVCSEILREYFLRSLAPDIILMGSLFEGLDDNVVTSLKSHVGDIACVAIFYDLVPLLFRKQYLSDEISLRWYFEKLDSLKRADLILAISESSKAELTVNTNISSDSVTAIMAAADVLVGPIIEAHNSSAPMQILGLHEPYFIYAGSYEPRKNFAVLIEAFSSYAKKSLSKDCLVLVTGDSKDVLSDISATCRRFDIDPCRVIVTGRMSDGELRSLYRAAIALVYPSLHEGFGLPVLEAMACDAAVVASNTSSLPEVVRDARFLFDPRSPSELAALMIKLAQDGTYRAASVDNGRLQAKRFSWPISGRLAWGAMEELLKRQPAVERRLDEDTYELLLRTLAEVDAVTKPSKRTLMKLADAIAFNLSPKLFCC